MLVALQLSRECDIDNQTVSDAERWAQLLDRYLAGDCTREEWLEFQSLLDTDPSLKAHLELVRPWWQQRPADRLSGPRVDAAFDRLEPAIAATAASAHNALRQRKSHSRRVIRAIGSIAAIALFSWFGYAAVRRVTRVQHWAIETLRGQRRELTLPDGSHVDVGPESRIAFVMTGSSNLEVTLVGQAYFAVAHDARRRFVVQASNAIIEDLGTQFLVRSYPTDSGVQVLVTEGEVSARSVGRSETRRLTRGTRASVTTAGEISLSPERNADEYLAWTKGKLVFHDTPATRAIEDLSRWFDIDIVLADSGISAVRIRGALPTNDVDVALDAFASAAGLNWKRNGHKVVLYGHHLRAKSSANRTSSRSQ